MYCCWRSSYQEVRVGDPINQFNPATYLCLSQAKTWIYNVIYSIMVFLCLVKKRGDYLFCYTPPQRSCRGVYWFQHVRPSVCRQILCRRITWVVFLRMFWNFISSLPVKRGGSLSFLTIFTFAVPELLNLIWLKIGFLPYVVW